MHFVIVIMKIKEIKNKAPKIASQVESPDSLTKSALLEAVRSRTAVISLRFPLESRTVADATLRVRAAALRVVY
jgi:hypothetical protein